MLTMRDAALEISRALPNGAATVTSATGIQIKGATTDEFAAPMEFELEAPSLAVGILADAATMTYSIVHATLADMSDAVVLAGNVLVQTGAGGAGAAAARIRYRAPSNSRAFIGLRAVNSAAGNASTRTAFLRLLK